MRKIWKKRDFKGWFTFFLLTVNSTEIVLKILALFHPFLPFNDTFNLKITYHSVKIQKMQIVNPNRTRCEHNLIVEIYLL